MPYGKTSKIKKTFSSITISLASPEAILERRLLSLPQVRAAAAVPVEREAQVPVVDVGQAIAICRMKGFGAAKNGGRAGRNVPEAPPIEQVRDEVLQRLAAIRRHRAARDGGVNEAG